MSIHCKVIVQTYESTSKEILRESTVFDLEVIKPTSSLDISLGISNQLEIMKRVQDHVVEDKMTLVTDSYKGKCPECQHKLIKAGMQGSPLHDVFTDHTVYLQRLRCPKCKHKTPSTINTLLGTTITGELVKIQAELGAKHSYRESEILLDLFSNTERKINNHDRVKNSTESVGTAISGIKKLETEVLEMKEADELVLNVDGGHINTKETGKRSFEALTSVIYNPESIESNSTGTRNKITSKSCAASAQEGSNDIINYTIIGALKQGMGPKTSVTALCDGASNCWKVAEALKPLCGSMVCILDWFHISMKMQNVSLPEKLKSKFLRVKWHLWRGNSDTAVIRLDQLQDSITSIKEINKIKKFKVYIENNKDKIVDYRRRHKNNQIFTSNLAESTVESLINQRCKGQQHMRWSRDGLEPVLQIRASMASKGEWESIWRTAVLNAA
jgi:hypothetical protein